MEWAPTFRRADSTWIPEWLCLRCNTTLDTDHPLLQMLPDRPLCAKHGERVLAVNLREGSRSWVCSRQAPPQVLPSLLACADARVTGASRHVDGRPALPFCARVRCMVCPTPASASSEFAPTHSWFFVPLLHASTQRLHHQVEGTWEASRFRAPWQTGLLGLRHAGPIPPTSLVRALQTTQQLAVADGRGEAHLPGRLHPSVSARGHPSILPRPPASSAPRA